MADSIWLICMVNYLHFILSIHYIYMDLISALHKDMV